MILTHKLKPQKSGRRTTHEVQLETVQSFAVVKERFHGEITDKGWYFEADVASEDGKYSDHAFGILIEAHELRAFRERLEEMERYFEDESLAGVHRPEGTEERDGAEV